MNRRLKNNGFSLTEVLLAAGILVIGFMLIAGTLPVGIKLTAIGTERTIGAVAADEAEALAARFEARGVSAARIGEVSGPGPGRIVCRRD